MQLSRFLEYPPSLLTGVSSRIILLRLIEIENNYLSYIYPEGKKEDLIYQGKFFFVKN